MDTGTLEARLESGPQPAPVGPRLLLATVIALAVVALCIFLGYYFSDRMDPVLLVLLTAAAGLGLLGVFGYVAGFVRIGFVAKHRQFYETLFDSLNDACLVTDAAGRVLHANSAYRNMLSSTALERNIGLENLYAGYPDIAERVYRLAQAAREKKSHVEEFRLSAGASAAGARPDMPAWFRASVHPMLLPGRAGKTCTLWRLADISDDRADQETAFTNLQFIINYLDNAPAGFFSTTETGEIAYLNSTLADWLELDLLATADGSITLTDILPKEQAALMQAVAPQPGGQKTEVFDIDLMAKNGTGIPVRIIHRTDYGLDGKPQPSRSLVLRLDTLNHPDAALLEDNVYYSRFFNQAPIGLAELSPEGTLLRINPALAKLCKHAKRGSHLAEIAGEDDRARLEAGFAQLKAGNHNGEAIDINFNGSEEATGSISFAAIPDGSGSETTSLMFVIDKTQHSSLEVQVAQGQKMQAVGQLAGGVAHDFNNVLTAIIGFSDLLLAKHRPTDPSFGDIMNIKQNANRAANLVRQLLAFSRRQTLRPEVLSLTDALSDLGNLLNRLLGEKVSLKLAHGRDIGKVKADINQFEQVIINLAVNARDAMPDGGTVTIRTANVSEAESADLYPDVLPAADYVLCEISDTGTGMPPDVMRKIYEPFFSTKEVGQGTGLGLSTVYGIIKQTGGFIFCDSTVGEGTTFSIYLPVYVETEADKEAAKEATKEQSKREDLTGQGVILLVEDEDAVRSFASRALQARGYTILEASSGEHALDVVAEHEGEIDLVLSDVVMPEMDGPTLLKELRKRGITSKVVFISGYAEDAFEKNLEGQEDFTFLPKPFTLKQLAETVKEVTA